MQRAATDPAAFKDLFERYYPRAVNVAYRMLGDRDQAEDIAMEAFAKIYEARDSYRASATFSTFLHRVISNLCLNAARRRRVVLEEPLEPERAADDSCDPASAVQRAELACAVRAAVLSLPPNQRLALVLTRYEQMSYQAAADAMNVSVGALESLLHRAKANLRKSLSKFAGSDEIF